MSVGLVGSRKHHIVHSSGHRHQFTCHKRMATLRQPSWLFKYSDSICTNGQLLC